MGDNQIASNSLDYLHNEDYGASFDSHPLTHETMVFMGGREVESLASGWRFTIDPFDTGLRQRWFALADTEPSQWAGPRDFDVDGGVPVDLPSCWNLLRPEYFHYEGSAWYSRRFPFVAGRPDERVFLRVGAASYEACVFLNGAFLGRHRGGSTPFFVELTDGLNDENLLQIHVNNTRTLDRVPMRHFDWFNYGGLHREVGIVRVPKQFIRDVFCFFDTSSNGGGIRLEVEVSDGAEAGDLRVRIADLGIDVRLPVSDGRCVARLEARPSLWSPSDPRLYDIEIEYGDDRVRDRVGFRTIAVEGNRVILNGRDIFLKGICVHEDDTALGRVTGAEDIRRRLAHARALGCNFLRLAHYPHHEMVARMCDEAGLLLWSEIPVYWAIDFSNRETFADAENQLVELVRRDRNRASIVIWGVGNENADTDARLDFMRGLTETARNWDPSRLVSAACLVNLDARRIEDRLAEHLDIIGINEYYGWYHGPVDDLIEIGCSAPPDKPIIITETGASARVGHRGSEHVYFTEDRMASVYREQLAAIRQMDNVRGLAPWVLYDFRSERRQNRFQDGFNRKGLIAEDKQTRKQAFELLRAFYGALPE